MKNKSKLNNFTKRLQAKKLKSSSGFTLMEIMVASMVFVIVSASLLSLFNYVLKINRRSEALRQASQGMRDFVEYLVKEIRNGQIDYYVAGGQTYTSAISASSPCVPPGSAGSSANTNPTYFLRENKLGLITTDNLQECFYFGKEDGSYVDSIGGAASTFASPAGQKYTLVLQKSGVSSAQILNPLNFWVENLMFLIRPIKDPYIAAGGYVETQPAVTIIIKFTVSLPTGETVPVYYQTSVSSNKYDIPNE